MCPFTFSRLKAGAPIGPNAPRGRKTRWFAQETERQRPVQVPLTTRKVSGSGTELMPGDSRNSTIPSANNLTSAMREGSQSSLRGLSGIDRRWLRHPLNLGFKRVRADSRRVARRAVQESATPRFGDEEWKRLVAAGKVADRFQLEVAVSPACRNDIHLIASVVRFAPPALVPDTDLPGRRLFRRRRPAWPRYPRWVTVRPSVSSYRIFVRDADGHSVPLSDLGRAAFSTKEKAGSKLLSSGDAVGTCSRSENSFA